MALSGSYRLRMLLVLASATVSHADGQILAQHTVQLRVIEVNEPEGQILSYRHLAGSTDVRMRGTRLAPKAEIKLKIGSRPGFVELDINRGGITGLEPAHRLGKDFLTYVLWAVSVDGKASNLGEITFEGERPVPVNLTTPYQTFWLMVTAEPNYAVVDPSARVVLYSVKQGLDERERRAPDQAAICSSSLTTRPMRLPLAARSTVFRTSFFRPARQWSSRPSLACWRPTAQGNARLKKEEAYTREAFRQAETFLARSEAAYKKNPKDQAVVQFARTSAQSAENARALAMGAVGDLLVRQLESELADVRDELARLRIAQATADKPSAPATAVDLPRPMPGLGRARARDARRSSFGQTAGAVVCCRRMGRRRGAALSPPVDLAAGRRRGKTIHGTPAHDTSVPRRLAGARRRAGARDLGRSERRSGAKRRGAVRCVFLLWRARGCCASELVLRPIPIALQRLGRRPHRSGAWAAAPPIPTW